MREWEQWCQRKQAEEFTVRQRQGSTAGANSSAFHAYRNTRRTEYNRLDMMELAFKKQAEADALRLKREAIEAKEQAARDKRRQKRLQKKANKKERTQQSATAAAADSGGGSAASSHKKRPRDDDVSGTATSAPPSQQQQQQQKKSKAAPALDLPDDGSFMEMFLKKQAEIEARSGSGAL